MRRMGYEFCALQGGRRRPHRSAPWIWKFCTLYAWRERLARLLAAPPTKFRGEMCCGAKTDRSHQGDRSYSNFSQHIIFNRAFIKLRERGAIWGWRHTHVDAGARSGNTLHGRDRHPIVPRGAYAVDRVYAQDPIGHQWRAYHAGLSV